MRNKHEKKWRHKAPERKRSFCPKLRGEARLVWHSARPRIDWATRQHGAATWTIAKKGSAITASPGRREAVAPTVSPPSDCRRVNPPPAHGLPRTGLLMNRNRSLYYQFVHWKCLGGSAAETACKAHRQPRPKRTDTPKDTAPADDCEVFLCQVPAQFKHEFIQSPTATCITTTTTSTPCY